MLFQLGCLAAAAVMLALWTALLLQLPLLEEFFAVWLVVLVVADLVLFLLLGNFLIERFVMRPLTETSAAAAAIADGDYARRVPSAQTREMHALSLAVNRLTDQLLQNQERLADNVRSLERSNRELFDAQQELIQAEKLASIGRLAAGVAHEIGNPLGALVGYVAVLRRRGADPALMEGMERESARIDRIVRGLLDYARPGGGVTEPIDVNQSVAGAIHLLQGQGRLDGIVVDLQLDRSLAPVSGVRHALEQVWVNLIANAAAAMRGSGTLRVATSVGRVEEEPMPARRADDPPGIDYSHLRRLRTAGRTQFPRLEPGTPIARIVVADSGPGIAEEHVEAIFDPFFTTKQPGEGTGLGLAIVAGTLAEMGGRIDLLPSVSGAVFQVTLPTAAEHG